MYPANVCNYSTPESLVRDSRHTEVLLQLCVGQYSFSDLDRSNEVLNAWFLTRVCILFHTLAPVQSPKHRNYNAAFFLTTSQEDKSGPQVVTSLSLYTALLLTPWNHISKSNPESALRLQVAYLLLKFVMFWRKTTQNRLFKMNKSKQKIYLLLYSKEFIIISAFLTMV